MQISKILAKAMIDKDITSIRDLAGRAGISYERASRLMNDKPSAKMIDVLAVANCLDIEIKFVSKDS